MIFLPTYLPFLMKKWKIKDKITYHVPLAMWELLESVECPITSQNSFLDTLEQKTRTPNFQSV